MCPATILLLLNDKEALVTARDSLISLIKYKIKKKKSFFLKLSDIEQLEIIKKVR